MTLDDCIKTLTEHNKWRRGEPPYDAMGVDLPCTPMQLGQAIEYAMERLHQLTDIVTKQHEDLERMVYYADLIITPKSTGTIKPETAKAELQKARDNLAHSAAEKDAEIARLQRVVAIYENALGDKNDPDNLGCTRSEAFAALAAAQQQQIKAE
jgi:hypothetical protein